MNEEQAKALRAPFPDDLIGKLPRLTCKDCSKAQGRVCPKHKKSRCAECGNYITSAHIHLDYVGHAAVTDRLHTVDPAWTWEPMVTQPDTGAPLFMPNEGGMPEEPQGLWGNLTVCGVTKPAFGGGKNAKECISDLIRNGAMRFGVGLDLWSKEDLHVDEKIAGETEVTPSPEPSGTAAGPDAARSPATDSRKAQIADRWNKLSAAEAKAKLEEIALPVLLRELLIVESDRPSPRKGVLTLISKRISVLEGEPPADNGVAQPVPGEAASPSEQLLRLQAALAFIAEQPSSVEDPEAWTVRGVLAGLMANGGGVYSTLEQVPGEWLERVWGALPKEVQQFSESLGPEALTEMAGKAK